MTLSDFQTELCKDTFSALETEDGYISVRNVNILMKEMGAEVDIENIECESGFMTFDQVLEMLTTAVGDDMFSKENLRETFEKWDIDGDGAISSAELRIALQTSFGDGLASIAAILTDEEVEDVMIEADEDGSGDISFDEFRRIVPYLRELTKM